MKIGIYGGSFDPIHQGHIALAETVQKALNLDRIFFVPALVSPLKKERPHVSGKERLEMLKLVLAPFSWAEVSSFELDSAKVPSYTIETILEFKKRYCKSPLFLIGGSDLLKHFLQWKNWKQILDQVQLVIVSRKGQEKSVPKELKQETILLDANLPDISSSEIRMGKCLDKVPLPVLQYIKKK